MVSEQEKQSMMGLEELAETRPQRKAATEAFDARFVDAYQSQDPKLLAQLEALIPLIQASKEPDGYFTVGNAAALEARLDGLLDIHPEE
jgi:hypothetical protein